VEIQKLSSQNNSLPQDNADSDIAQIIYTSGTTGEPKGVMLRHSNLMANARSIMEYLKLGTEERHMVVLPFFYSFGNSILLTHFAVGATLVVHQSFLYPKVILEMMLNEKVTGLSGVPSTYALLLNRSSIRNYSFTDLRYLAQAGGAMSPKLALELKEILPQVDLFIMYGQTEASARLSFLEPQELIRKSGSIGRAIPGVSLRVLDKEGNPVKPGETGEIVAQGENIMAGYWEDPERTAQVIRKEGLWTGDLARMDEEGYLYIVSRRSEMIKSGAHRIGPKEIEEIILEHDAVHEVAVFGTDDLILGEAINACIVLKDAVSCSKKDILILCKKNLPAFKVPHHICFCDGLPKNASGKVKKHEIKI
jgi:acyl-CoA synthetase (AMP-forming)/AMP-acid ligase II